MYKHHAVELVAAFQETSMVKKTVTYAGPRQQRKGTRVWIRGFDGVKCIILHYFAIPAMISVAFHPGVHAITDDLHAVWHKVRRALLQVYMGRLSYKLVD